MESHDLRVKGVMPSLLISTFPSLSVTFEKKQERRGKKVNQMRMRGEGGRGLVEMTIFFEE